MVHIAFDPSLISFNDYQVGYGGAGGEYSYFKGLPPYQRGYGYYQQRGAGLGDVLRGVWRFLLPVIRSPAMKEIGQAVGREVLTSGSSILSKVAEGDSVKSAVLEEGKSAAESLLEKGIEKIKSSRQQQQKGRGLPIKGKKRRVAIIPS